MSQTALKSDASQLLNAGEMALRRGEYSYSLNGARLLLWQAQTDLYWPGVRCGCGCGQALLPRLRFPRAPERDTVDHVQPKGLSGPDRLGNLLLLTWKCNALKAQRWPDRKQITLLERVNARLGWTTPPHLIHE